MAGVPVQVLGALGTDRVQVAGAFHASDRLVVASVPLAHGTFPRFGGPAGVADALPLDPSARGAVANVVAPTAPGGADRPDRLAGRRSRPSRRSRPGPRPGRPRCRPGRRRSRR